jgi:hypothetical protein
VVASASPTGEGATEELKRRIQEEQRLPQTRGIDVGRIDAVRRLVDSRRRKLEELRRRLDQREQEPPATT